MHRDPPSLDRRRFLTGGSVALLAALHGAAARGEDPDPPGNGAGPRHDGDHRLLDLRLATAAPLAAMVRFYRDDLGFAVLASAHGEVTFAAGATRLTFFAATKPADAAHDPFYHFAFNIPENKLLGALAWQRERTRIIPPPPRGRDPAFPDEVMHFPHWDAHSVFFWDPAGNLVEYIARHTLANPAPGPFTAADILYASEIAFIVDDVLATADTLRETFGVKQYRQGGEAFMAMGDERGLLLVMKRGRNLGLTERKDAGIYPTHASVRGPRHGTLELEGFPYTVSSD